MDGSLLAVIAIAFVFEWTNGWHDATNAIATSVGSRIMSMGWALLYCGIGNAAGALFTDQKVAENISKIVDIKFVTQEELFAGLLAAVVWSIATWWRGIPSSSTHAVLLGTLGSVCVGSNFNRAAINWSGVEAIALSLVLSPLLGFVFAYAIMKLSVRWQGEQLSKSQETVFKVLQFLTAGLMSYSHGRNDSQKTLGIVLLALRKAGVLGMSDSLPYELFVASALIMGLGSWVGGKRIIKTYECGLTHMTVRKGAISEGSGGLVVTIFSHFGLSVSTTHSVGGAICGSAAALDPRQVQWGMSKDIVKAWIYTIPACAVMGGLFALIFSRAM